MLKLGQQIRRAGSRISRRELLRVGSVGALGVGLADLLQLEARATLAQAPARSVIVLWLWGGPSHIDLFDPKPRAPLEYRGPYSPISTNVPGIELSELLPRLAKRMDRCTLLRALHHSSNDHGIAGTISLTGSQKGARSLGGQVLPGEVQPCHGSIVSRLGDRVAWPPSFVSLGGHLNQGHQPITGEGGGVLGATYDPFRVNYDSQRGLQTPQLHLVDGVSPSGLDARRQLLAEFDRKAAHWERQLALGTHSHQYAQAFSLLTSAEARGVLDVDREPIELRDRYGRFRFGRCCLLARRLVESGARFVQVNWSSDVESLEDTGDGGWDTHDRIFPQIHDRHAWMLDQALTALLDDLSDRGLLAETMVLVLGEFGRTPKINHKAGRDHWEQCYSAVVAGGGLRAGHVVGASDRLGERPARRPVTPGDLFTTVLRQLGVTTPQLTELNLVPNGDVIEELG